MHKQKKYWQGELAKGDTIIKQEHELNHEITDKEVMVISATGEKLGVMSAEKANALADAAELDLVKISPNAVPPVCKIMDYGKYMFDKTKREKEQRKNQKVVEIKEIQLSMTIELHDMQIKAKNAEKFLNQGNKVKVALRMRGRQQAYFEKGIEIVKQFAGLVENVGAMDKEPKVEGRNVIVLINPKKLK